MSSTVRNKRMMYFACTLVYIGAIYYSYQVRWWTLYGVIGFCICFVAENSSVRHTLFPVPKRKSTLDMPSPTADLKPGEGISLVLYNYLKDFEASEPNKDQKGLRVLTWNIECGFKLPKIIAHLKKVNADIVLLQEVDIYCPRSGAVDIGVEIAIAIGLPYVFFACEGPTAGGNQGNAILSRYKFNDCLSHVIPCGRLYGHGKAKHACAVANIKTPLGSVDTWCLHFDSYQTGARGRAMQWQSVASQIEKTWEEQESMGYSVKKVAICGGDLNTIANSYRRFFPMFCTDDLRWKSIGYSESEWLEEHVLKGTNWHDPSMGAKTMKIMRGILSSDKIDWILLNGAKVFPGTTYHTGGEDASDHAYLWMDIEF